MKRKIAGMLVFFMTFSAPAGVFGAEFWDGEETSGFLTESVQMPAENEQEECDRTEGNQAESDQMEESLTENAESPAAFETDDMEILSGEGLSDVLEDGEAAEEWDSSTDLYLTQEDDEGASGEFTDDFTESDGEDEEEEHFYAEGFEYRILSEDSVEIMEYCSNEENVIVPDTLDGRRVKLIAESAFFYNTRLVSVHISDNVEKIGREAFSHCLNLVSVHLPEKLQVIESGVFRNDGKLKEINFPESLTCIGTQAFDTCTSLTEISLNSQLRIIHAGAFSDCYSLQKVFIPENVSEIEDNPFDFCKNLCEIQVDTRNTHYVSLDGVLLTKDLTFLQCYPPSKKGVSYTVPVGVAAIGRSAFCLNRYLEKIVLPEGVTLIDNNAFAGCRNLSSVQFPSSLKRIRVGAFTGCKKLTEAVLFEGLERIEDDAFSDGGLKEIVIPKSVKMLCMDAFARGPITKITILSRDAEIMEYYLPGTVIYGYTNSTAQTYALQNGNKFISLDPKRPASVKMNKLSVVSGDHIKISWKKTAGADGYMVYKKVGGKWKRLKKIDGFTYSYIDQNTKIGTVYQYSVKAFMNTEKGILLGSGDNKGLSVKQTYYSKEPVKFKAEAVSTKSVKITWTARSKATGYVIYRKRYGEKWKRLKVVGKTNTYTDNSCKSATTYFYTIKAYTKSGGKNIYSRGNDAGIAATTKLLTPKVKVKSTAKGSVVITWTRQNNVSGYVVYQKQDSVLWSRIKVLDSKASSFTDKYADSGETYYYTVRAYKKADPSKGIPKNLYSSHRKGIKVKVR